MGYNEILWTEEVPCLVYILFNGGYLMIYIRRRNDKSKLAFFVTSILEDQSENVRFKKLLKGKPNKNCLGY